MMSLCQLARLHATAILCIFLASAASAQTPGVLYTWDHSFGVGAGPNVEGWSGNGTNVPSLSNATDGALTITESVAGGDWGIAENYNIIKESAVKDDFTGNFDFGGVDLTGLRGVQFDLAHSGSSSINGQVFLQADPGGACCTFNTAAFTINPGPAQTVEIDFDAIGLTAAHRKDIRSMGLQVFGNGEAAPLEWTLSEVRSVGTPLSSRVLADHTAGGLQNAVVKFDNLAVLGSTGNENQTGLSNVAGTLRWVDLGGTGEMGDESGGAVAWGNGNALAVTYDSRPMDLSNYGVAIVRMKATPGAGGASQVDVQLYAQYANRATGNAFAFQSTDLTLAADGEFHDLEFPIDGFVDKDLTQWLGINLQPHAGGALQIQVESVILRVPEPTSMTLVLISGCVALVGRRGRRS